MPFQERWSLYWKEALLKWLMCLIVHITDLFYTLMSYIQGSSCVFARPMSLIGWAHAQNDPCILGPFIEKIVVNGMKFICLIRTFISHQSYNWRHQIHLFDDYFLPHKFCVLAHLFWTSFVSKFFSIILIGIAMIVVKFNMAISFEKKNLPWPEFKFVFMSCLYCGWCVKNGMLVLTHDVMNSLNFTGLDTYFLPNLAVGQPSNNMDLSEIEIFLGIIIIFFFGICNE